MIGPRDDTTAGKWLAKITTDGDAADVIQLPSVASWAEAEALKAKHGADLIGSSADTDAEMIAAGVWRQVGD